MSEDSKPILVERDGFITTITFNRPEKHNAVTWEMAQQFHDAVQAASSDGETRVILLTGTGKGFCSGADLTAMQFAPDGGVTGPLGMAEKIKSFYPHLLSIGDVEIPTIACINGSAVGAGLAIAMLCDIRVVAEDAKLALNFSRIGIHPGMATTYMAPKLFGWSRASELLFTGRRFSGKEAFDWGFANQVTSKEDCLPTAQAMAKEIALSSPWVVRYTKRTMRRHRALDLVGAVEEEALAQALCAGLEDAGEGLQAWMQKRDPEFKGK